MELPLTLPLVLLCGALFAAAVGVYQNLLRRIQESSGKVRTAEIELPDLLVTLVLTSSFAMLAVRGFLTSPAATAAPLKADQVLPGATFFLILVAGIVFFLHYREVNLRRFLGFDRLTIGRAIVVGAGLAIASYPLVLGAAWLAQIFLHEAAREQDLVTLFRDVSQKSDHLAMAKILAAGVLFAPITEEFIFRGYFYSVLKRYCGGGFSALITAALFAAIHMNLSSLPSLFILALCLTIAYEATGSLLVPIGMHAFFNFSQLGFLYWSAQIHAP